MSIVQPRPLPIIISPPSGTSTLPIVELDKVAVETDRVQIRLRKGSRKRSEADCSFGNFSDTLEVDAWPLFHAAKKTELTSSFTSDQIDRRALGFSAENDGLFIWNTDNLRRIDRSVFSLEDFAQTGLAGRFGEAVAYLTMIKWGFVHWDRISVLWERAAKHGGMTHNEMVRNAHVISARIASGRPDLESDFVFERATSEVALMEAKGSFVHPINDDPSIKDDLRHALKQLDAWSAMIAPPPAKSYAIGTYFRDVGDNNGDPSLIAFVDPPPAPSDEPVTPVEFPRDWIRRGNFGAWLIGMGFPNSGNALRHGIEIGLPEQELTIVNVGGREFVISFDGVVLKRSRSRPPVIPWEAPWILLDEFFPPQFHPRFLRDMGVLAYRILGIDLNTLRLVEESVLNPRSESLLRLARSPSEVLESKRPLNGFAGSIFPDGTLFGSLAPELILETRTETFRL